MEQWLAEEWAVGFIAQPSFLSHTCTSTQVRESSLTLLLPQLSPPLPHAFLAMVYYPLKPEPKETLKLLLVGDLSRRRETHQSLIHLGSTMCKPCDWARRLGLSKPSFLSATLE